MVVFGFGVKINLSLGNNIWKSLVMVRVVRTSGSKGKLGSMPCVVHAPSNKNS